MCGGTWRCFNLSTSIFRTTCRLEPSVRSTYLLKEQPGHSSTLHGFNFTLNLTDLDPGEDEAVAEVLRAVLVTGDVHVDEHRALLYLLERLVVHEFLMAVSNKRKGENVNKKSFEGK